MPGIVTTHVHAVALVFVELHEVCMHPPPKSIQNPLDDILSFQQVNHTKKLVVLSKHVGGALNPVVLTKMLNCTSLSTD